MAVETTLPFPADADAVADATAARPHRALAATVRGVFARRVASLAAGVGPPRCTRWSRGWRATWAPRLTAAATACRRDSPRTHGRYVASG